MKSDRIERKILRGELAANADALKSVYLLGNCTFFHGWRAIRERAEDSRRWEERGNRPPVQRPAAKCVDCGRTQSSQRFWKMAVLLLQGSTFTVANPATERTAAAAAALDTTSATRAFTPCETAQDSLTAWKRPLLPLAASNLIGRYQRNEENTYNTLYCRIFCMRNTSVEI